jgi:hypothetical protein
MALITAIQQQSMMESSYSSYAYAESSTESSAALDDALNEPRQALDELYRTFLGGCAPYAFSGEWSPWEAPADAYITSELIEETFAELSGHFGPAVLAQSGLFTASENGQLTPHPSLASPGQSCLAISDPGTANITDLLNSQGCVRQRTLSIFALCQEPRTMADLDRFPTIVLSANLSDVVIYRTLGIAAAPLPDLDELDGQTAEEFARAIKRGNFGVQERRDTRSSGDRENRRAAKPARKNPVRVIVALGSIANDFAVAPAAQTFARFLRELAEHFDPVYQDVGIWALRDRTRQQIKLLRGLNCPERLTDAINNSMAVDTQLLGTILEERRARNRNLASATRDLDTAFAAPENDYDGALRHHAIENYRRVVDRQLLDPILRAAHAADSPIDRVNLFDFANTTEIMAAQMTSIREKLRHPRSYDAAATSAEISQYLKTSYHQLASSRAMPHRCHQILSTPRTLPASPYDFLF